MTLRIAFSGISCPISADSTSEKMTSASSLMIKPDPLLLASDKDDKMNPSLRINKRTFVLLDVCIARFFSIVWSQVD